MYVDLITLQNDNKAPKEENEIIKSNESVTKQSLITVFA